MKSTQIAFVSFIALSLLCVPVSAAEIYSGESLGEALHDLAGQATQVSREVATAPPHLRSDIFRLSDGRLLAITSRCRRPGEPYTIVTLRVTPSSAAKLTRKLPPIASVTLPRKRPMRHATD